MAGTTVKHTKDVTGEKPKWWYYVVAILLILIFLFQVYILLNLSFRTIQDIGSKLMLPKEWNFQNYVDAFSSGDLWIGFKNSIILVVETVVVEIVASALAAYGLARSSGRIAESIRSVNMGIPATMFMYINFIVAIPTAFDEAASIDGAGVLTTFFRVIMPQLKAVTVTRIIVSAVGCWNNYLMPMYLLQDKSKFTIILVIKSAFNATNGLGNLPLACATCVLGLFPVILLYLFLQKYIIEGQIDSSVK